MPQLGSVCEFVGE